MIDSPLSSADKKRPQGLSPPGAEIVPPRQRAKAFC